MGGSASAEVELFGGDTIRHPFESEIGILESLDRLRASAEESGSECMDCQAGEHGGNSEIYHFIFDFYTKSVEQ